MRDVKIHLALLLILLCSALSPAQTIRYQQTETALHIYYQDSTKPVISFPLGETFLTIAEGKEKVDFKMGSFKFKDVQYIDEFVDHIVCKQNGDTISLSLYPYLGTEIDDKNSWEILIYPGTNRSLVIKLVPIYPLFNRITLTFQSNAQERILGMGEQFSYVDLKGHKVPVWVEEQGLGRGDKGISFFTGLAGVKGNHYTTYAPMPWMMTTDGRGILCQNTEFQEYDFRKDDKITLEVWSDSLNLLIWQEPKPLDLLEKYTAHTGRMPKLPDWALGTILGLQGGDRKVMDATREALKAHNPVSAVWIQDWVGRRPTKYGDRLWWNWIPDTIRYGNMKEFTGDLAEMNIKTLGYINSFMVPGTAMTDTAIAHGYLVKTQTGEPYLMPAGGFDAYLVDLSNPEAFEWLKGIIKTNLIGNGFSGWMADFCEWLPWDAKIYSGEAASAFHNRYPVEWARLNREAIKEAGKEGEVMFFTRAGYTGSAKYSTMFWAGDQLHTYGPNDGMRSAITALLSSGLSGISLNHSDAGGYTTVKTPFYKSRRDWDLFCRWNEWAIFTPVFRTHEGLRPKENVQFYDDTTTQRMFAHYGRIHAALKPYFQALNTEATEKGYPMVRHLYLHYPKDPEIWNAPYQFMLGSDILVAPVLAKKEFKVKVYLPAGEWEHLFSKTKYTGGQWYEIAVPYGQPAAFVRAGSKWVKELNGKF